MIRFRFFLDDLPVGNYEFRARAVSVAGNGPWMDYHEFFIIKPVNEVSKGWYLLAAVVATILICITTVSYYYRHKIMTLKRQNDNVHLLDDIAPTNFEDVSLHYESNAGKHKKSLLNLMEFN